MTEVQQVILDLLKRFIGFCEENNLTYYASGGTLLGAVRHRGFIPWDDDADILMPREDYNRFIIISKEMDQYPYFIQNTYSEPAFAKNITRLRNSSTTNIPVREIMQTYNQGIFIDIFPLDLIPEDEKDFNRFFNHYRTLRAIKTHVCRYYNDKSRREYKSSAKKLISLLFISPLCKLKILTPAGMENRIQRHLQKYNDSDSNDIGGIACNFNNKKFIYRKEWYRESLKLPFEDIMISVPAEYDSILKTSYGDYMTPVHARSDHGETINDAHIPYNQYIEEHSEELERIYKEYKEKMIREKRQ